MKLWSAGTRLPCARSASRRCEPMKPAPPETTARCFPLGLLAADTPVREAKLAHRRRHVDVASVDEDRRAHRASDAREVELAELVPFGHEDQRIRAGGHLVRVLAVLEVREDLLRPFHGGRIVR